MAFIIPVVQERLETAQNIWFASVRAEVRPHLAPIWFAWTEEKFYICTESASVKARNISINPHVVLALEDGLHPVICEGQAKPIAPPWPARVLEIFMAKYKWDIITDRQYDQIIEITPSKWLTW